MAKDTDKKLRNQVIYQIFTRNYKDGTFKAVEADLDRIKALGVDIIYLVPIQPSGEVHRKGSMGSPYAIKDYRAVDPVQGTMEDFVSLCSAVHDKGMKIMIDVVYNHTSPDSWLAQNHPEWFYHKEDGSFGNHVGDWWDVIDLDYSQPGLWDYQIDTLKMWAQYVDGFRCDVAPMIPLDFWLRARKEVAEIRPGCIWLSESGEPDFLAFLRQEGLEASSDSEMYQAFDICYIHDIYEDLKSVLLGEEKLETYLGKINQQECIFPDNYVKLRFLENHDRPRAAALIPDAQVLRNWTAFNFFEKGTALVYAGEENSAVHHPTLFDLDTVDFESGEDISAFIAQLSAVKRDEIFALGAFRAKTVGSGSSVIFASYEAPKHASCITRRAVGIFSTTGRTESIRVDLENGIYTDAISGKTYDVFEQAMAYDGEPAIFLCR